MGDTGEDGLDGSAGWVAEERGEGPVGFDEDSVTGLDVEDGLKVGELRVCQFE